MSGRETQVPTRQGKVMRANIRAIQDRHNDSDGYVGAFVGSLIFLGDTIAIIALPIWAGISYATDTNYHSGTDIFGGIISALIALVVYVIFSGIFWNILSFVLIFTLAIPLGIAKLIRGDFSE